ncbi:MAG: Rnase Y domain-containing protein, partial [Candidatus Omnitrophica bacterium]|nr:Rnase Y domain-containing protein [Candidatus Omnitrophota bacterium]
MLSVVFFIVISGCFLYLGYFLRRYVAEKKIKDAETQAKLIIEQAKKEAENRRREVELEAKEELLRLHQEFEQQTKDRRQELADLEKRLNIKEENLERRLEILEKKEKEIQTRIDNFTRQEETFKLKEAQLTQLISEEKERLQKISSLSPEEAKKILLARINEELTMEKAQLIKKMEEEILEQADRKAKEILSLAIQRCAAEHTMETTISVVNLPNEEMKGRVIGREGRNIRALEMATGVDIIIDDTPEAVTISAFDPVRREIARIALERLIADGRIHPGRIEEIVEKTAKEMEEKIKEEAERTLLEIGITGLHPELVKLIGRLKYRTSFG